MKNVKIQNIRDLFRLIKQVNQSLIPKKYRKDFFGILILETLAGQSWIITAIIWSKVLDLVTMKNVPNAISTLMIFVVSYQGITFLRNLLS